MSGWRLASAHCHSDNSGPPGSDNGDTPGGVAGAQERATHVMISCGSFHPAWGRRIRLGIVPFRATKSAFTFRDIGFTIRVEGGARLSAGLGVAVSGIRGPPTIVLGPP